MYTLEAVLKLLGLGVLNYFESYWNIFDFSVTVLGILSLVLEAVNIPLFYIVILRPLRYVRVKKTILANIKFTTYSMFSQFLSDF